MHAAETRRPRTVSLETPDYIVRTVGPADATSDWRNWLTDPDAARNLNARPEQLSEDALRGYIASFDGATAYLFGIFEKTSGRLVGIRAVYVDLKRAEFLVNVLIGEREARNKGARTQSRRAVYQYFFENLNLHTARSTVLAVNEAVLAGMAKRGWVHEHTDHRPAVNGQGFVELHHFRLTRDAWRRANAAP